MLTIKLWGTRGATPVPQAAGNASSLGGNTSCVEVSVPGCDPLILDAGTGLHCLGEALLQEVSSTERARAHILLTHTHWGHIQGIPFFNPMLVCGNQFTFYGCGSAGYSLADLLNFQMDTVYCPVPNPLRGDTGADAEIREIDEGGFAIGPVRISARRVNHAPGSVCMGYRLEAGPVSLAYLPDVEYLEAAHRDPALELAAGVDLLIHDAHFTAAEYQRHRGHGHCSDLDAVRLAREAGADRLLLFHHHPDRLDASEYATGTASAIVEPAREGTCYVLGSGG